MHTLSSCSLLILALIIILTTSATATAENISAIRSMEAQALLTFKHAITHDPSSCLSSWPLLLNATTTNLTATFSCTSQSQPQYGPAGSPPLNGTIDNASHCSWFGLLCDNQSRIISLNLSHCSLSGSIWPSLGLLSSISTIDLSNNNFSGVLSPSLFPCPNSSLTYLDLSHNPGLSGHIPPSLPLHSPNLQFLDLSHTNLSGAVPPALWTHLPALKALAIRSTSNNDNPLLSIAPGSFPPTGNMFSFCATIEVLALMGLNASQASFPSSLGDCLRLKRLELSVSGWHGSIPSSIWQLPSLESLVIEDPDIEDLWITYSVSVHDRYNLEWSMPFTLGFCNPAASTITEISISGIGLIGPIPPSIGTCGGSLQSLSISQTSVEGPLPSTLGSLTRLHSLTIKRNQFLTGEIPDALGSLMNLVSLDLFGNKLNGAIPATLGALTSLQALDLSQNSLTGEIPAALGALGKLHALDLSQNNLTGEIPHAVGALTSLAQIDLSDNNLLGTFPFSLLHNLRDLHTLSFSQNSLTGNLDSLDLSKLPRLRIFNAYGNKFEGGLPAGLTEHQELIFFNVQGNQFLTGSLGNTATTANITGLSNLKVLSVSYNELNGDIPAWLWHLPSLQVLDLSNNRFTGHLPASLTGLSYFCMSNQTNDIDITLKGQKLPLTIRNENFILSYLQNAWIWFDVSVNMLGGEIPKSFGELQGLTGLNLSHNEFNDTIQESSFGRLKNLETLDLSYNQLTGEIPKDLASVDISTLDLSNNQLQGHIPTQYNFNTRYDQSAFANNSGLCGFPLPDACNTGNITGRKKRCNRRKEMTSWCFDLDP